MPALLLVPSLPTPNEPQLWQSKHQNTFRDSTPSHVSF